MKIAKQFRDTAIAALRGRWSLALAASFVASLLGGTLFDLKFTYTYSTETEVSDEATLDLFSDFLGVLLLALPYIIVISLVWFTIGSIVKIGHARFYLDIIDGAPTRVGVLFSYFSRWKEALIAELIKLVLTILGFLLFIVPGIIVLYTYCMTPYILAENENMKATEALRASRELMSGKRFRLFCLHFSFIGWIILSLLSFGIGFLWLNPYLNTASSDFYRCISYTANIPYLRVDEFSESGNGGSGGNDWYYGN